MFLTAQCDGEQRTTHLRNPVSGDQHCFMTTSAKPRPPRLLLLCQALQPGIVVITYGDKLNVSTRQSEEDIYNETSFVLTGSRESE